MVANGPFTEIFEERLKNSISFKLTGSRLASKMSQDHIEHLLMSTQADSIEEVTQS
jgi:hypothetical protein